MSDVTAGLTRALGFILVATTTVITFPAAAWTIDTVDNGVSAEAVSPRSVALDSSENPHAAHGGDGLRHSWDDGSGWQSELVDSTLGAGWRAAVAIDATDGVHIAYYNRMNGDVRYATNETGVWSTELVGSASAYENAVYVSLAVSDVGDAHIAWTAISDGPLRYATNTSGTWAAEVVDAADSLDVSIAVDKDGAAHIAYAKMATRDLAYATNETGSWALADVDIEGDVGSNNSIALRNASEPHIVYFDNTSGALKHAVRFGADWAAELIDNAGQAGQNASLGIDDSGTLHVAYREINTAELRYAAGTFDNWTVSPISTSASGDRTSLAVTDDGSTVHVTYRDYGDLSVRHAVYDGTSWYLGFLAPAAVVGTHTSITLDELGAPQIAYRDDSAGALKLARHVGPLWQTEVVHAVGNVGIDTSMVVDDAGVTHVAFQDIGNLELVYANDASGSWQAEVVDTGGGSYPSMALDSAGEVHIAYRTNPFYLRYAHGHAGSWSLETVTGGPGNDSGREASLVLDDEDGVWIAYRQTDDGSVHLANNTSGSWQFETVDAGPNVGQHMSLALDDAGAAHLLYYDQVIYKVVHATDAGGSWVRQQVSAFAAKDTALAVAPNGELHGLYTQHNELYHGLLQADGSWAVDLVDPIDETGSYGSLVVDDRGAVHIAYHYDDGNDLRYATDAQGFEAWPDALDFGDVYIGSYTEAVTVVENVGSVELVLDAQIAGPAAEAYTLDAVCTTVAVDDDCVVIVSFEPSTEGALDATLTVGGDVTITLTGAGLALPEPELPEEKKCSVAGGPEGAWPVGLLALLLVRRRRA